MDGGYLRVRGHDAHRLAASGIAAPARVVAGDHVAQGKPHSECYRRGAAMLSRNPSDCVVVEDAPAGVRAAKAAGCEVVAVLTSHTPEGLREADWIVESLREIAVRIDDVATLKLSFQARVR